MKQSPNTRKGRVRKVEAWAIITRNELYHGSFAKKSDAETYALMTDKIIPCTIIYSLPFTKKKS